MHTRNRHELTLTRYSIKGDPYVQISPGYGRYIVERLIGSQTFK
jgi:hypothetical protein